MRQVRDNNNHSHSTLPLRRTPVNVGHSGVDDRSPAPLPDAGDCTGRTGRYLILVLVRAETYL
jgi:hypothetical protein